MESTIVQNGALYQAQHPHTRDRKLEDTTKVLMPCGILRAASFSLCLA